MWLHDRKTKPQELADPICLLHTKKIPEVVLPYVCKMAFQVYLSSQKKLCHCNAMQASIIATPFNQKSPGHTEVDVLQFHKHTDRHSHGPHNSMTDSVKLSNT